MRPCYLQHRRTSRHMQRTQRHHRGSDKHLQTPWCPRQKRCLSRLLHLRCFSSLFCVFRMRVSEVTGVTSVGETPEKKPHQYASQLRVISLVAQKTTTQCIVDETMSSSLTTAANAESQKKKSESKLAGSCMSESEIQRLIVFLHCLSLTED